MATMLIVYFSKSGNTKKMAEAIAEGALRGGIRADVKNAEKIKASELREYDSIVIGSPTYYGSMAYQIKRLLDESVEFHGELEGRVGAAFASSANIAGGNETTVLDILNAMLIHGMVVQGDPRGDHYGAVSIGAPDNRALAECSRLGERAALLAKKLRG